MQTDPTFSRTELIRTQGMHKARLGWQLRFRKLPSQCEDRERVERFELAKKGVYVGTSSSDDGHSASGGVIHS